MAEEPTIYMNVPTNVGSLPVGDDGTSLRAVEVSLSGRVCRVDVFLQRILSGRQSCF